MSGIVFHSTIFDEHGEMPFSIVALDPSEFVEVRVESEGSCGFERLAHSSFDVGDKSLETHLVDSVLETLIISTAQASSRGNLQHSFGRLCSRYPSGST